MNYNNPMLLIDGYKLDHRRQYPKGTTNVYSNWTPRSSRVEGQKEVVLFGLQYFCKKYLIEDMKTYFFDRPKAEVCKEYQEFVDSYLGPNDIGTDHIAALHDLGYLPIKIDALPEGSKCSLRVPMLTVENTYDDFYWLTNYIETLMSNILWMPCTSGTTSYRMRKMLNNYAEKCGSTAGDCAFSLHDFSMRGMAGIESACLSGAGHLMSSFGTDTIPAIGLIQKYYPNNNTFIGGSVPATEHSVSSAGGQLNEGQTLDHLLDLYPSGIFSFVSDTWSLWNVITNIVASRKSKIISRNGKLVLRPDSGDPVKIICGDPDAPKDSPQYKGVIELLWDIFGGTVSNNGYKILDSHIGCIYGDAITYARCQEICEKLMAKGFSTINMVYGVGSYTYQYNTRDTYGFAMKATSAVVNGKLIELFKKPVTDDGTKFSATGRLLVGQNSDGTYYVKEKVDAAEEAKSCLKNVFINGVMTKEVSFDEVRNTLWKN